MSRALETLGPFRLSNKMNSAKPLPCFWPKLCLCNTRSRPGVLDGAAIYAAFPSSPTNVLCSNPPVSSRISARAGECSAYILKEACEPDADFLVTCWMSEVSRTRDVSSAFSEDPARSEGHKCPSRLELRA
jgi:hypothetical protein